MTEVFIVIRDNGDGSQSLEWHKDMSDEKVAELEVQEEYMSGDGIQVTALTLPCDLDTFTALNNIYWYEDDTEETN